MGTRISIREGDWVGLRQQLQRLANISIGPAAKPTFRDLTLTDLDATRLVGTDADKMLVSADLVSYVDGTANEIEITDDGDGTITIGIVDPLIVGKGGTGAATLTDHGIILGSGTGAVTVLAEASDGQLPIGSTGNDPVLATLTGTANQITVTNGAGSITLSTPQDIATTSSPTFDNLSLTGNLIITDDAWIGLTGGASDRLVFDTSGHYLISYDMDWWIYQEGQSAQYGATIASDNATHGFLFDGYRSRNTIASPSAVQNGDALGYLRFRAYQNGGWKYGAEIEIDSNAAPAGDHVPCVVKFKVDDGSALTTYMSLASTGLTTTNARCTGTATYGLDVSGGTWTASLNLTASPIIYANGTKAIKLDDSNYNVFLGTGAFNNDDEGQYNIGIGYQAGYNNDTSGGGNQGKYITCIGYQAGFGGTGGTGHKGIGNTFIGWRAGYYTTTGNYNLMMGYSAGMDLTEGVANIGLGYLALQNITTGNYNIAIGYLAGETMTTGGSNILIGSNSGSSITDGEYNCGIGLNALRSLTTGNGNVGIGRNAVYYNQTGSGNTGIGFYAGGGSAGGVNSHSFNTSIGYYAGAKLTTGASNVYIGNYAGYNQTTGANLCIIDNQDRGSVANEAVRSLIYGTFAATPEAQELRINGTVTLGNLEDGHYTQVEADGTVEFNGNATVWNDANVGAMQLTLPAAGQPDEDEFVDENGDDTGITTWAFAIGEYVSGSIEIPHDYKEGSDIYFHVHWQGIAAPGGGTDNVNWQLTYTVAQKDETLDAVTTITKETAIDTQYDFKLSDFAAITGTNFNIGDQFLFTLERIAASADDYAGDALVATAGLHYECDTVGSRQITTK